MRRRTVLMLLAVAHPASALAADYPCLIEPWQLLKLATSVPGVVASVEVDRGDRVQKGQVVATLDSDVEESNVLIAQVHAANESAVQAGRARLDFLRRKQTRNDTLRQTDAVSVAQAELNVAQARLEAKRAAGLLQQRRVVSPVSGVVTERALGPGEYRNDQAHILTVAQLDPLRIETFLPIGMYAHVKPGETAQVMPEAPVGGQHAATVTVVDQVFDAASGTVGVRLEMPNPGGLLPAGLHCTVRFPNAS